MLKATQKARQAAGGGKTRWVMTTIRHASNHVEDAYRPS
jgi:hypothetical protein